MSSGDLSTPTEENVRRNAIQLIVTTVIAVLLAGCSMGYAGKSADYPSSPGYAPSPQSTEAMEADFESDDGDMRLAKLDEESVGRTTTLTGPPAPPPPPPPAGAQPVGPTPSKVAKPMLIYTGTVTMAVFETRKSVDSVHAMAKEMGGYLVQRNDTRITIRVPSEKFNDALKQIEAFGDVLNRDESVRDVTEEFYDLKTRLDNARATRDRLQALLEKAADVKDVLAIETELSRVTEFIERMEGKLKRIRELVGFSTITVEFRAKGDETANPSVRLPFPWLNSLGLTELLSL